MLYVSFTECDILMHYHWGLGVGHEHAHGIPQTTSVQPITIMPIPYEKAEEDGGSQQSLPPKQAVAVKETQAAQTGEPSGW